ncbi:MAG: putative inorganic carbon transporter subunit DabA, partial [Nitrospira sp.]
AAWLEAYELSHLRQIVGTLSRKTAGSIAGDHSSVRPGVRPLAQFAFCIDVRSEVFRRHLERRGGYETFGFAGFFGLPVSFRPLDEPHETELCPVLLRPKHVVREVPRTYDDRTAQRRRITQRAAKSGRELLHDLKHNVITPYVMVEAVGWFFGWPLIGKTLFPKWYDQIATWFAGKVFPKVATTLTVDKLTTAEAEEMVAVDQRRRILEWLRSRRQVEGTALTPERLEAIRLQALGEHHESAVTPGELGHLLVLTKAHETRLLDELRQACRINPRETTARIDRMIRTGFTTTEQAYYVETALRLMGLTTTFARLIFLCGHESHSENNPYESSLDCGACGGSGGLPNARTFATIANRAGVRELLAQRGIAIPSDTRFVAAVHDTTTDRLTIADLEDVPSTHRRELAQVMDDLAGASADSAAERHGRLEGRTVVASASSAANRRRSHDWAQVRPEWGLARNSLFIIGGRRLTYGTDLEGRSFLHSYDYRIDPDGKLLEVIMTAPLIVAEWINLEYYFSTVAPDIFGSGSKVYHNVTGRIGVMS